MPITIKVTPVMMKQMQSFYEDQILDKTLNYVLFQAKVEGCSITAYTSHKVVFQGPNELTEATIWESIKQPTAIKESPKLKISPLTSHIGSDEVGTGDFFGPITVGACLVLEADIPYLKSLGIMDSKKIDDVKIRQLAPLIKERCHYATSLVNNEQYNQMIEQYNQGAIKALLHNDALNKLLSQLNQSYPIIMDQFVNEKKYYDYLKNQKNVVKNIHFLTKAEDQYLAVACGSIIARELFLDCMDLISRRINKEVPKGAGKHVDEFARSLLLDFPPSLFNKIAKTHFSNMQRILE